MGSLDRRVRKRQQGPQTERPANCLNVIFVAHLRIPPSSINRLKPLNVSCVLVVDERVFCHYLDYCEMRFTGSLTSEPIVKNLKVISTSNSCCELQDYLLSV